MLRVRILSLGRTAALITTAAIGAVGGVAAAEHDSHAASLYVGQAESQATARALKGPKFPGARRCPGEVNAAGGIGFDIRVRHGSCRVAKRAIRRSRYKRDRLVSPGWRCRSVGGYYDGGFFRCNRHRTTIQFGAGV